MNTWIIVAVYVANDVTFYQLRLCIESILREVPRNHYARLLVVDDYSSYDYAAFRDHYKGDNRVEFLMLGGPRPSFYGAKGRGGEQGTQTSIGHGEALHSGTLYAKEHGAEIVWSLDSDTIVLDGSCLVKAVGVLNQQDIIRSVGDYAWGRPSVRTGLCFSHHRLGMQGEERPKIDAKEGKTNAICGIWCVKDYNYEYNTTIDWGDGGIGRQFLARFTTMGQAATRVVEGLWSTGYATAYFPFFWDPYVVHFGYGTLIFTREQTKVRGVGNAPDAKARYGGHSQGNYYAGFLQLKCSTTDFHNHLRKICRNRAFDDVSARFNRKLIGPPDPIPAP